jgi:hypothetical protein
VNLKGLKLVLELVLKLVLVLGLKLVLVLLVLDTVAQCYL